MSSVFRLRRDLATAQVLTIWDTSIHQLPLANANPETLYTILSDAYATGFGEVPPFQTWWSTLTNDSEFDPELVIIAANSHDEPIGLAQCWTSGFIKDLAVVAAWRGKGVGKTLLNQAFQIFQQRGLPHCDLKVMAENTPAIALYHRLGMTIAPD